MKKTHVQGYCKKLGPMFRVFCGKKQNKTKKNDPLERHIPVYCNKWAPRGVLRFELDRGVPLEPQNPYPSLRVIVAEKGTHF